MNDIENVWNRILDHCSLNLIEPEYIFTTIRGLKFYIVRIDENTVHPYRIEANPILYDISKNDILNDLELGRPFNNDRPGIYGIPAPSYRFALLNDERIFHI